MKKVHNIFHFLVSIALMTGITITTFGDMLTPTPTRPPTSPLQPAGYDWASIVGGSLWAIAAVLIILFLARKLIKRSSK